jgi:hypothetical protein
MTDFHSTLDAIDRATGCQQCEGPLRDSPDDDFCSENCRVEWHASRAAAETRRAQTATVTVSLARAAVRAPAHTAEAEIQAVWVNGALSEQICPPLDPGDLAMVAFNGEIYYSTVTGAFAWPNPGSEPGAGWTKVGPADPRRSQ